MLDDTIGSSSSASASPQQLSTLLSVSAALTSSLELPVVLQTAIEAAVEVLGLETGAIYVLDDDMLYLGATTPPLPSDLPDEFRHARLADHPHVARCLREAHPILLPDARSAELTGAEREVCEARGLRSILYVPLLVKDDGIGVIIVSTVSETAEFGDASIDLCRTLAYQISLAVANAQLFEKAQRSREDLALAYDDALRGWSLALDMRDEDTSGHTERVTEVTVALARSLGVPEGEISLMKRGALLHDIGKMVVPDAILHKPGPLTDDEWAVMRSHPEHARRMIEEIDYLTTALDIPYCHHERWDGTGYPRGLSGEEIPLSARIFAIVDVYDALISDRPYRPAWRRDTAIDYISTQSGKHFDPRVTQAFLDLMARPESVDASPADEGTSSVTPMTA